MTAQLFKAKKLRGLTRRASETVQGVGLVGRGGDSTVQGVCLVGRGGDSTVQGAGHVISGCN